MKIYDGSMLHGRLKGSSNTLTEFGTLDLGLIPEDVFANDVIPLIKQLNSVLNKYNVYVWGSSGYHEDE